MYAHKGMTLCIRDYCSIGERREREGGRGVLYTDLPLPVRSGWTKSETIPPPYHCNTITAIVRDLAGELMVSRACNTDREPSPATTHGQKRACPPLTPDTKEMHYANPTVL